MDYQHFALISLLFLAFHVVVLARPKMCTFGGRVYYHGDQITLENCTYLCTCDTATQTTALFLCVPLCARYIDRACPHGYIESNVMVQTGPSASGCFCAVHKCTKSNDLRISLCKAKQANKWMNYKLRSPGRQKLQCSRGLELER